MFQNSVRAFSMLFFGRTLFGANLLPGTLLRNISTVCDKNVLKLYSGSEEYSIFWSRPLRVEFVAQRAVCTARIPVVCESGPDSSI